VRRWLTGLVGGADDDAVDMQEPGPGIAPRDPPSGGLMLVVHVHVRVRPEDLEAFLTETRRNGAASLEESGVRRFDVLQDEGDAGHLVLNEVYVDRLGHHPGDRVPPARVVSRVLVRVGRRLRTSTLFASVFPGESG
jgi:autoinducer 2-degrading protein